MYIVHVSPISKGVGKESLSYFTSKKVSLGNIVVVPIKNKKVDSIVLKIEDAVASKALLKSSKFKLKKIEEIKKGDVLSPSFISTSSKASEYFACSMGSILNSMAKPALNELLNCNKITIKKGNENKNTRREIFLIQDEDAERTSMYKGIIREEFAKGNSVFFCLPEISEIDKISKILKKGIEKYTFILHSALSKKQLSENWNNAIKTKHPVLIIATGTYLSIFRSDLGVIILDKESASSYKMIARPFIDVRIFAEFLAKDMNIQLIFGDTVLRPETIYKKEQGEYSEYFPLKFRYLSTAKIMLINMKPDKDATGSEKEKDEYISVEFKNILKKAKENSENVFVLVARRGIHTITICNDCGEIILCERCNVPAILHSKISSKKNPLKEVKNKFVCHKCGFEKDALDKCNLCGSWRLATLGAGIEKVEELLKKEVSHTEILRIDSESVKTRKTATDIRDDFYSTPGSILLGTEMAIPYLYEKISNVVIFSVDSLFSIPDFKIEERIFNILLRLRINASKSFLIQTRDIKNKLFNFATRGNLIDFYREEIGFRKDIGYPPFSTLIKITMRGNKISVTKEMEKLAKVLSKYDPVVFPAFIPIIKNKYQINMLIKISPGKWPDKNLVRIFRSLPMSFIVNVEPNDIL